MVHIHFLLLKGVMLQNKKVVQWWLTSVYLEHKTHKLFYNCSAYAKAADEEVSSVLEFIYNLKAKSKFTKKLQDSVTLAKAEPMFKDEYMYFADILEDEVEKAQEIGYNRGAQQKADEDAVALLKLNKLSLEEISSSICIPLAHVKELAAQLEK